LCPNTSKRGPYVGNCFCFLKAVAGRKLENSSLKAKRPGQDRDALFYETHCIIPSRIVKLNFHFFKNIFYSNVFNHFRTPFYRCENSLSKPFFSSFGTFLRFSARISLEVKETKVLALC